LIRTLRGLTPVFGCFNDDGFEEEQFEQQLAAEPSLGIAPSCTGFASCRRILANDRVAAVAAAPKQNASSGCRQSSSSGPTTTYTLAGADRALRGGF
jgi:hypothetical protein